MEVGHGSGGEAGKHSLGPGNSLMHDSTWSLKGHRCTRETTGAALSKSKAGESPWGQQSSGGNWSEARAGTAVLRTVGVTFSKRLTGSPRVTQQVCPSDPALSLAEGQDERGSR